MSNAVIKEIYIPKGRHNRPGRTRKARGLLYHTTNNWSKGADAEAHANFLRNTNNYTSWHVTVDHDSAVQHLPFNESAYHAGDGGHVLRHRQQRPPLVGDEIVVGLDHRVRGDASQQSEHQRQVPSEQLPCQRSLATHALPMTPANRHRPREPCDHKDHNERYARNRDVAVRARAR